MKKPISNLTETRKRRIFKALDSIFSAACLVLALRAMMLLGFEATNPDYALLHFALAATKIMRAIDARTDGKAAVIKNICYASIYCVAGVLVLLLGLTVFTVMFMVCSFFVSVASNRVFSIISDHRIRNIVFNVIAILLIAAFVFSLPYLPGPEFMMYFNIHLLVVAFSALAHIIYISFSQMRFNILQKILRKTFAAEILFGLLLLILSFSFVFYTIETSVPTYGDALWYCFAVITTIGFGDIAVVSVFSRILSVILGVYGIIVVALITSVIVNFYNEIKDSSDDAPGPAASPAQSGSDAPETSAAATETTAAETPDNPEN